MDWNADRACSSYGVGENAAKSRSASSSLRHIRSRVFSMNTISSSREMCSLSVSWSRCNSGTPCLLHCSTDCLSLLMVVASSTACSSCSSVIRLNLRRQPLVILRREPTRLAMKIPHSPAASELSRCVNSDPSAASWTRARIARQWTISPSSAKSREFQSAQCDLLRIHPPDVPSLEGERTNDCSRSRTVGDGAVSGTPPDSTIK